MHANCLGARKFMCAVEINGVKLREKNGTYAKSINVYM